MGNTYLLDNLTKINRFPGRSHQVWLEPEGYDTNVVYPNGLSCTMPADLQLQMLRTIPGLEKVQMIRPGMKRNHKLYKVYGYFYDDYNLLIRN